MQHHVVRGDAALGDRPRRAGRPARQRTIRDRAADTVAGDRAGCPPRRGRRRPPGWCTAARPSGPARGDLRAVPPPPRRPRPARRPVPAGTSSSMSVVARAGPQRGHLPAGLPDVGADHDQAVPARPGPRSAARAPQICAPRRGGSGPRPLSARTNDGPVRNRNDCPSRSASSTARATVSRSEYSVALTTTHAPPAAPASTSRTRAGPPSRMSARLMLRTPPAGSSPRFSPQRKPAGPKPRTRTQRPSRTRSHRPGPARRRCEPSGCRPRSPGLPPGTPGPAERRRSRGRPCPAGPPAARRPPPSRGRAAWSRSG